MREDHSTPRPLDAAALDLQTKNGDTPSTRPISKLFDYKSTQSLAPPSTIYQPGQLSSTRSISARTRSSTTTYRPGTSSKPPRLEQQPPSKITPTQARSKRKLMGRPVDDTESIDIQDDASMRTVSAPRGKRRPVASSIGFGRLYVGESGEGEEGIKDKGDTTRIQEPSSSAITYVAGVLANMANTAAEGSLGLLDGGDDLEEESGGIREIDELDVELADRRTDGR
jgi:hypothetical protein